MIRKNSILKRLTSCPETCRLDDDFFVIDITADDFPEIPVINHMYQCSVCISGVCKSRVNLKTVVSPPGSVGFTLPGQVVEIISVSEDYKATLISLSPEFISSMGFPYNLNISNVLTSNPVVLPSKEENEAIRLFCGMARRILARQRPHIHEILRNLTSAMIYSMADSIVAKIPPVLSREENLAQQYINNVSQNYHRRRKVIDYASEMNITPGYLSSVVKNVTGKSAAEWIEEYVLMEARALLASTDMTIQQICYQLNFPTQSFFGKYFKTHTGVSPKAYRMRYFVSRSVGNEYEKFFAEDLENRDICVNFVSD